MRELKELFETLPKMEEMELINRQHEAERAERIAHAEAEIIRQAREWRTALRRQALKERDDA